MSTRSSGGGWPLGFAGLLVLGVWAGLSPAFAGHYQSSSWVPLGLVLLVLLGVVTVARPPSLSGPGAAAIVALVALGLWALASSSWGESAQQAVNEGNRWLVLATVLGIALVLLHADRRPAVLIAALALGIFAVGGWVLARMLSAQPGDLFLSGRLNEPLGYINAEATVFLMGFWLCLAAAERRQVVLAALGASGATVLGCLALLSQSRGAALAILASAVIVLALVPGRIRRAYALATVAAGILLASPKLLHVYDAGVAGAVGGNVTRDAALITVVTALVVGGLWAVLTGSHRQLATREQTAHDMHRFAAGALLAAAALALVVALASAGRISDRVDREYDAFVHLTVSQADTGGTGSRLVSGGGTRYDYWRIAWAEFKEKPVAGWGAGNYDRPYFERRSNPEDIRQPHSIELQTLSELGLVGGALLLLFVGAVGAGALRLARHARRSDHARAIAVAATGGFTAWLTHTSVDWMHVVPGVTAIALCLAAILLLPAEPADTAGELPAAGARWKAALPAVLAAAIVALAGASLARQGLAELFQERGREALPGDPAKALREADRSLSYDPTAVDAYYVKAAALARFNRADEAESVLLRAAAEEPGDFVTWTLLGDLMVRRGNLARAQAYYRRGARLNPLDPTLRSLSADPGSAAALP